MADGKGDAGLLSANAREKKEEKKVDFSGAQHDFSIQHSFKVIELVFCVFCAYCLLAADRLTAHDSIRRVCFECFRTCWPIPLNTYNRFT